MNSTGVKLPTGSVTTHIRETYGGDSNIMKFYCTTNESAFGRHWQPFEPRIGRHSGAGYQSNFRPTLSYHPRMDEVDNPTMGQIVKRNYMSVTTRDFRPYTRSDGNVEFPAAMHRGQGIYDKDVAITTPNDRQVTGAFIDKRIRSAPCDMAGKRRPLLYKVHHKDQIEAENLGHGPSSNSTEYGNRYQKPVPGSNAFELMNIGSKEYTGYVRNNKDVDPVQHSPMPAYKGDKEPWMTHRPTGITTYNTQYRELAFLKGDEPLPIVTGNRDSGFVKGNADNTNLGEPNKSKAYDLAENLPSPRLEHLKRTNPAEYHNALHNGDGKSIYACDYDGKQIPAPTKADMVGRSTTGPMGISGYVTNAEPVVVTKRDDPRRFITHYMTKFYDTVAQGEDREGHLNFGVESINDSAFSTSGATHKFENDRDAFKFLRRLEPYQARSRIAREYLPTDATKIVFNR